MLVIGICHVGASTWCLNMASASALHLTIILDHVRAAIRPALKRRLWKAVHAGMSAITTMPYWQRHLLNDRLYPDYL